MNRRPSHEPSRPFPQPRRLWDDATRHAPSLGCPTCLERDRCGGVHTDAGILDCRDLCSCQDKTKCDMVCRFNPRTFVARMREVGGLGFETAPRAAVIGVPLLPAIVPFVDHRYGRAATLDEPAVAISLYELVNLATGKPHVASRAELSARFLIPKARRSSCPASTRMAPSSDGGSSRTAPPSWPPCRRSASRSSRRPTTAS